MKKQFSAIIYASALLIANNSFGQFTNPPTITPNTAPIATGGKVGIGVAAPSASLHILGTGNQLRLGYSTTLFSNINVTSGGHLVFRPGTTTGKVAFGINAPAAGVGFHSNMGVFRISDSLSATRALQVSPNFVANGEIPAGVAILTPITSGVEGLSLLPAGGSTNGIKLGAYAWSSTGWKSVWETANSTTGNPNLILAKSGGNVGIGTGASAPTAKLQVAGQVKIVDGTQGVNKVLTSDASGLASWQPINGLLAGGTTNYIPKWTSANALSSTSSIYDDNYNVGIGTNTPSEHFQIGDRFVFHDGGSKYLGYNTHWNTTNGTSVRLVQDFATSINFGGGNINFLTDISGIAGSAINATSKLFIQNTTGNIGIGSTTPNKKLTVVGDASISSSAVNAFDIADAATGTVNFRVTNTGLVYAHEVNVQLGNFPDYVFAKNYKLTPLNEVEQFINANKHLKGFEPAKEYESNGMNVGDVVKLQQEKIEELTLYLIEQQKQLTELKKQIESIKK